MRLISKPIRLFRNWVSVRNGLALILVFFVVNIACTKKLSPSSFDVHANFSVNEDIRSLSTAIATIEKRPGAPGYFWIRIYFYSFPPTSEDISAAVRGDIQPMEKKWNEKASNPEDYNHSHAVIQLGVDKGFKVWQVDLSVPGHGCTIASFEQDVKKFLDNYRCDGKQITLKSRGSYLCDMSFMKSPNTKYEWDVDLNLPVFKKETDK